VCVVCQYFFFVLFSVIGVMRVRCLSVTTVEKPELRFMSIGSGDDKELMFQTHKKKTEAMR
jgi:hypothetical protein